MAVSSNSTWLEEFNLKAHFPKLKNAAKADVVIIGAGITGLTTAYLLSQSGKKVILLEKGTIGSGATGYSTAFLTQVIDTDLTSLLELFGKKDTKDVWDSHGKAITFIEEIISKEAITCEFTRCASYNYALNESEFEDLRTEWEAAKKIGIKMKLKRDKALVFDNCGYLEISNQAKFNPIQYITSLAHICAKRGVKIFERTEVSTMYGENPLFVCANDNEIEAKYVVIATHNPFNKPIEIHFKKGQYATYVMEAHIEKGKYREGIYEDLENPYHYFRIDSQDKYDRLIIGGEDHREDLPINTRKSFRALEDYLQRIISKKEYKIVKKWIGPIVEPIDGLAFIGPLSSNPRQLYATGFSGTGITYGTIAAHILTDYIFGEKNQYAPLYNLRRIPSFKQLVHKGIDYSHELLGGAVKNSLTK